MLAHVIISYIHVTCYIVATYPSEYFVFSKAARALPSLHDEDANRDRAQLDLGKILETLLPLHNSVPDESKTTAILAYLAIIMPKNIHKPQANGMLSSNYLLLLCLTTSISNLCFLLLDLHLNQPQLQFLDIGLTIPKPNQCFHFHHHIPFYGQWITKV